MEIYRLRLYPKRWSRENRVALLSCSNAAVHSAETLAKLSDLRRLLGKKVTNLDYCGFMPSRISHKSCQFPFDQIICCILEW